MHALRVEPALWTAALVRATAQGETLSSVIRRALMDYVSAAPRSPSTERVEMVEK